MGVYSSILITPTNPREATIFESAVERPPRPAESHDLDFVCNSILGLFKFYDFVSAEFVGTHHETGGTSHSTGHLFEGLPPNERFIDSTNDFRHYFVDQKHIKKKLSEFVPCETYGEVYPDSDFDETPETQVCLPSIDIFVFQEPIVVESNYRDEVECEPWAIIEFDLAPYKYDEEYCRVRNENHPILADLATIFGSKPETIVYLW